MAFCSSLATMECLLCVLQFWQDFCRQTRPKMRCEESRFFVNFACEIIARGDEERAADFCCWVTTQQITANRLTRSHLSSYALFSIRYICLRKARVSETCGGHFAAVVTLKKCTLVKLLRLPYAMHILHVCRIPTAETCEQKHIRRPLLKEKADRS